MSRRAPCPADDARALFAECEGGLGNESVRDGVCMGSTRGECVCVCVCVCVWAPWVCVCVCVEGVWLMLGNPTCEMERFNL